MEKEQRNQTQIVTRGAKKKKQLRSAKTKTEIEVEDKCDYGQILTYDVLRIILSKLNYKDLSRAAKVCKSWQEAAEKEKKTRREPVCFLLHGDSPQLKESCPRIDAGDLCIEPELAVLFTRALRPQCGTVKQKKKGCYCLNHPCRTITLENYGVIGETTELENDSTAISCLFLPDIPGVKIRPFHYDGVAKNYRYICDIDEDEKNLKCIIMFANDYKSDSAKRILEYFVFDREKNGQEKIAIWGGIANGLKIDYSKTRAAGISICGANISAWSIVLGETINTKELVEKKLATLRSNVVLQKYSVGLMFACCGRGVGMFDEENVESTIFKRLFPDVPLVGSFGGGEFGITTIPDDDENEGVIHEFSTVFLILSYG